MSKVKQRKNHKQKLETFKQKQMSKTKKENVGQQMPEIRNIPTWDKDAKIELRGYEWEVLYNSIAELQIMAQVAQGVMSNNILNGVINMDFQKLDPKTLTYVNMTDEEKVPYIKDFKEMVEKMRTMSEAGVVPVAKTDETTTIVNEDDLPTTNGGDVQDSEQEPKGAKIITMS